MAIYNVTMEVPLGTYVVLQKWCSPEFALEIGKPSQIGHQVQNKRIWTVQQKNVFERLENLYADKTLGGIKACEK